MRDDPSGEEPRNEETTPPQTAEEATAAPNEKNDLKNDLQGMIGESLKQYYSKRLSQPLPDKFSILLQALAEKEGD